jgi:hypothetical protein
LNAPIVDVRAADAEHAADPAAEEGADDADHDVEEEALLGVRLHDQSSQASR